jgi:hypothetical protein
MKTAFIILTTGILLSACNNNENQPKENTATPVDSTLTGGKTNSSATKTDNAIGDVIGSYLQLKNALASDNSSDAAKAGNELQKAIESTDAAAFSADQQKVFNDVKEDAVEHATHIASNSGNITHQREHFETLSKDVYDMVKVFRSGQTLYQTYCPMYNNNKGATWLSETKEIKNPYFGAKMLTCGEVKEEIR